MTDSDKFFERLQADARRLRFEPDEATATRIAARIRERIAEQPSAAVFLARWFRPVAASLSALALAAVLGIAWFEKGTGEADVEAIAAGSEIEIAVAGDFYRVSN
ncbi:MAG TPA: hypothetical protein VNL91_07325 [Thermoanaerobaculia bacterium]|nr:hypothetical protein [Thermoanaerobaculia bacterium]